MGVEGLKAGVLSSDIFLSVTNTKRLFPNNKQLFDIIAIVVFRKFLASKH